MKILLVRPISEKATNITPPLGLGYLAGALRREHNVQILDCVKENIDLSYFEEFITKHKFDVVGIQVFSCDASSALRMADSIKTETPKTKVVVGGPHISGCPDFVLNEDIDFGFQGEAEIGFPMLLQTLHLPHTYPRIPGLIFREGTALEKNTPYFEEDIDKFDVAWDLIHPETYPIVPHGSFVKNPPSCPVMTTRGCPYQCAYCNGRASTGSLLRKRSIENIMREIDLLYQRGIREIHIEDDNFTFNREFVKAFCLAVMERRKAGLLKDICFACPNGIRLETLDEYILEDMEKAGFYSFAIGIESGNNRILKKMNRHTTKEKMKEKIELIASKTKIRMTGFCMMGYPTETLQEMEETAEFTRRLPIHRVQYGNFHPLPGTPVFDELVAGGYDPNDKWDSYQDNTISYSPDGIAPEQLKRTMARAFRRFYFRPKIIYGMLKEIKDWRQFKILLKRGFESFL